MKRSALWLPILAPLSLVIQCGVSLQDLFTNNAPGNPLKAAADDIRDFWVNDATDINDNLNQQRRDDARVRRSGA